MTYPLFDLDSAIALAEVGDAADYSAFGSQPFFLFELGQVEPELKLQTWLRATSCPVVGVGQPDSALAAACDVVVDTASAAEGLIDGVMANPVAAATFVRLLRITESMPLIDALEVESLAYATLQAGAEYQGWLEQHRRAEPRQHVDEGPAVLVSRDGDGIALQLNRPSNQNAMSVEMRDALNEAFGGFLQDGGPESIRISGRGQCFSTGGDLTEFGLVSDAASGHIIRALSVPGRRLAACADRVTAVLHGACVGSGIEFPAFAGRVVAKPDAWFSLPEVGMGLIPGAGGCISIARRIGRQRLALWGLSGMKLDADMACDWGLVDEVQDA